MLVKILKKQKLNFSRRTLFRMNELVSNIFFDWFYNKSDCIGRKTEAFFWTKHLDKERRMKILKM